MNTKLAGDRVDEEIAGKPDAGEPHVRFDKEEQAACCLLYR